MFDRYIFEDPADPAVRIQVGGWGYVAAALGGSLYVLRKAGGPGFKPAVVRHLAMLVILLLAIGASSELPGSQQLVALIVAIPGVLALQSLWMVRIIRKSMQTRGWVVDASV
jgi:hypothetical protein